jgi:hypothetical protein
MAAFGQQAAVDAMVQLAVHARLGVQAAELRPLLDLVGKGKYGWMRDWANDQLRAMLQ